MIDVTGKAVVAPDFSTIDEFAGVFPGWCAWRYEDRCSGKKPAKVPFGKRGRLSTAEPASWLAYSDARVFFNGGGFDGLGVLMTGSNGVVAFDVDGCLDDAGNVVAEHDAVAALEAMGSYIEVSPGGRGLRGFVIGAKPEGCRE